MHQTPSSGGELQTSSEEEYQPSGLTIESKLFRGSKKLWFPHPYQKKAVRLLISQAAGGLLMDPGLGKTSCALAAFQVLKDKGMVRRMLVVAPLQVVQIAWPMEIEKWEEFQYLSYSVLHGKTRTIAHLQSHSDIDLINPEGLPWLYATVNVTERYDVLCIDESTLFKNSTTKRFKQLKPWLPFFKRRWILTGTPVPNGIMDLFGQIYILDLGRALGLNITRFRNEFCYLAGYSGYEWILKEGSYSKIVDRISPLVLRLKAEDHIEMPEKITSVKYVRLPKEVQKRYNKVERDFVSGDIVAANSAVAGVKCRQIANGAVYLDNDQVEILHEEKLDCLENLLEEIGATPALILYEFLHDAARIRERIPGIEVLGDGATEEEAKAVVGRFNAGSILRLCGHPKSIGRGLNLQGACSHVVWYAPPWNLEHYDQANARVYRQGQESPSVHIHHIIAVDTKDEDVYEVLKLKDRTQQNLLLALHAHRRGVLDVP